MSLTIKEAAELLDLGRKSCLDLGFQRAVRVFVDARNAIEDPLLRYYAIQKCEFITRQSLYDAREDHLGRHEMFEATARASWMAAAILRSVR